MERLKKLRKEKNKTQTEIADYLNTTAQSYGRYELGQNEPNIETLCKLADLYNVSLDYLVDRDFNNQFGYLSDQERALIESFRKLNEVNQIKASSYILGILSVQE